MISKNKKVGILVILYLFFLTVVCRLVFAIPDSKYLNILNIDRFYTLGCFLSFLSVMVTFFILKVDNIKRLIIIFMATLVIFASIGGFYYINLPKYTYQEAAEEVEKYVAQTGKTVKIEHPTNREDKIGLSKKSFLQTTNYLYYIYVNVENTVEVYKFNPLDGVFEKSNRKMSE